jgi:hypothetical protein
MKHLLGLTAALILVASTASAQIGLPVVDSWRPLGDGLISGSVGYSTGDDVDFFGVRANYGLTHYMDLFLDVGSADVEGADNGIAFQLGTVLQIPVNLVCPLSVRVSFYDADLDDANITAANGALTTGMEFKSVPGLAAGFAIGFSDIEFEVESTPFDILTKSTEPYFSVGGSYNINETMALWAELTHVDDVFFSLGASKVF